MKKSYLFSAALLALAMTACDSEEPMGNNPGGNGTETAGQYMAITISNPAGRADDIKYENGLAAEDAIKAENLRFFFYYANGEPFMMTGSPVNANGVSTTSNMITPIDVTANNVNDAVAAVQNAVLVLGKEAEGGNQGYNGGIPAKVICVANATGTELSQYENKNFAAVKNLFHTAPDGGLTGESGSFIMTSSSYMSGSDNIFWSDIKAKNICADPATAKDNPVQIYIERLAAKVRVNKFPTDAVVKDTENNDLVISYTKLNDDNNLVKVEEQKVYAEVAGWDVNTVDNTAYGIKNIEAYDFFTNTTVWNGVVRCFWETSKSAAAMPNTFVPNKVTNAAGAVKYIYPNTVDKYLAGTTYKGNDDFRTEVNFARSHATKVIVAANLYFDEAKTQALQLMYWAGAYYTPEALCKVVADFTKAETVTYTRCTTIGDNKTSELNQHFSVEFYDGNDNKLDVKPASFWNGMGYYIINIANDLNDKEGKALFGVVRNHVYSYDLTKFVGLGTPVPVTDQETNVENPTEGETYVAAQLNILNWRLVSHETVLQ